MNCSRPYNPDMPYCASNVSSCGMVLGFCDYQLLTQILRKRRETYDKEAMATPTPPAAPPTDPVLRANCPCGSAKPFWQCHGATAPVPLVAATPELARPPVTRKLDLACGQNPRPGFEGVDIFPGAQHVVNLLRYPWPFDDNSVAELSCSHFIEHIPMWFVDPSGEPIEGPRGMQEGQDALLRFFDECWRVLVPGGAMKIVWPASRSDRAFQDPTHRRYIPEHMVLYLNAEWRRVNGLDHYRAVCNFDVNCGQTYDQAIQTRAPEVQRQLLFNQWNNVVDLVADIVARK